MGDTCCFLNDISVHLTRLNDVLLSYKGSLNRVSSDVLELAYVRCIQAEFCSVRGMQNMQYVFR